MKLAPENPLRAMAAGLAPTAPVSSLILAGLAGELETGGPVAAVLRAHPAAGSPLFGIRALAGLHHLMLLGRAEELAAHLAESDGSNSWEVARTAILANIEHIRAALDQPVQQHQPDRGGKLLHGLALLGAPKVRLLEIGACAGLNLVVDRYHWRGSNGEWGNSASPVRLTTPGPIPSDVEIVYRAGCDLAPRDAANPADVAILQSFIPPECTARQAELDSALRLAAESGVTIERADARQWLATELDRRDGDTLTVVWHSLVWQYLDRAQQADIEDILGDAAKRAPIARIGYEPGEWSLPAQLQLTLYGS
ncbi:MAG TPA: DUF2332 domain-containing protein [Amycolatopsis sp.]|nr:DUF2332 domain-containing protein [Amycolatopsis sp.]